MSRRWLHKIPSCARRDGTRKSRCDRPGLRNVMHLCDSLTILVTRRRRRTCDGQITEGHCQSCDCGKEYLTHHKVPSDLPTANDERCGLLLASILNIRHPGIQQKFPMEPCWARDCSLRDHPGPAFPSRRPAFTSVTARTFGESRLLKQTREHAHLGWCQSQRLACCRGNKLIFRFFTNTRYVPRMLPTVRFDLEGRGCWAFDDR